VTTATASSVSLTVSRKNYHEVVNRSGRGGPQTTNFRIHAPRFPKPQTEGMFVLIGSREKDEVYALKRVGWPSSNGGFRGFRDEVAANVTLEMPPGLEGTDATIWCLSDAYIGVETMLGVKLQSNLTVLGTWIEKSDAPADEASGYVW